MGLACRNCTKDRGLATSSSGSLALGFPKAREPQHIHSNCTLEPTGHSMIRAFGRLQVPMDGIHLMPPFHKGETMNRLVRIRGEEQLRAACFVDFVFLAGSTFSKLGLRPPVHTTTFKKNICRFLFWSFHCS